MVAIVNTSCVLCAVSLCKRRIETPPANTQKVDKRKMENQQTNETLFFVVIVTVTRL